MPEHFHLLAGEPRVKKLSTAMQVVKQRMALRCQWEEEEERVARRSSDVPRRLIHTLRRLTRSSPPGPHEPGRYRG